jgi:hypothetical protein
MRDGVLLRELVATRRWRRAYSLISPDEALAKENPLCRRGHSLTERPFGLVFGKEHFTARRQVVIASFLVSSVLRRDGTDKSTLLRVFASRNALLINALQIRPTTQCV